MFINTTHTRTQHTKQCTGTQVSERAGTHVDLSYVCVCVCIFVKLLVAHQANRVNREHTKPTAGTSASTAAASTCRSRCVKNETILFWTQGAIKSYLPTNTLHTVWRPARRHCTTVQVMAALPYIDRHAHSHTHAHIFQPHNSTTRCTHTHSRVA